MFRSVEVGAAVSTETFDEESKGLRLDLINLQYDLREADFPLIVMLAGNDEPAAEEVIDRFRQWFDPRYMAIEYLPEPADADHSRPGFLRFWRALPPHGAFGVFLGGWMQWHLMERLRGSLDEHLAARGLEHMRRFERMLLDDGALILKFWLHLPKAALAKRVNGGPAHRRSWRIGPDDAWLLEQYDRASEVFARFIEETNSVDAPWRLVEATDARHRDLVVGRALRETLRARLAQGRAPTSPRRALDAPPLTPIAPHTSPSALDLCDLTRSVAKRAYEARFAELAPRIRAIARHRAEAQRTTVLAFEGWDAAGKGGVIRRLLSAMSPRDVRVHPIGAPNELERAHHWLWRFWTRLDEPGRVIIFDRSWYGRVLVERVEGFADEKAWRRAYTEINDFEQQLVEKGFIVRKFWLHIDRAEQKRRFDDRRKTAYKSYKFTEEDERNRARWDDYLVAADDMIRLTHRTDAPWHVVAANEKRAARLEVFERFCDAPDVPE